MKTRIYQGHRPEMAEADVHVVIDVIRAFTTAWLAFEQGAQEILLVGDIAEAFALRERYPDYLLAGERDALRIEGFDLGNSPWAMTQSDVDGRGIIFTTTNGVTATLHALGHCAEGGAVYVTGYLGAAQTVEAIEAMAAEDVDLRVNLIASHPTGDEDVACAEWMRARLLGAASIPHDEVVRRILESEAACKFFDPERPQYDARDMDFVIVRGSASRAILARERDGVPTLLPLDPSGLSRI